jgi:hypothetical protein
MEFIRLLYGNLVFLCSFGMFYIHLVGFAAVWYILWSFGMFSPFWYVARG